MGGSFWREIHLVFLFSRKTRYEISKLKLCLTFFLVNHDGVMIQFKCQKCGEKIRWVMEAGLWYNTQIRTGTYKNFNGNAYVLKLEKSPSYFLYLYNRFNGYFYNFFFNNCWGYSMKYFKTIEKSEGQKAVLLNANKFFNS